jgi:hypothetical protein
VANQDTYQEEPGRKGKEERKKGNQETRTRIRNKDQDSKDQ